MPRTFPPQLSQQTDQRMHTLSGIIGRAKLRISKFQAVHDGAWEEAFSLIEEHDADARFIARDGFTIQKQKRQRQEYVDAQRLHDAMLVAYGNEEKWGQITEPVLNPAFAADSNALFAKLFEVLGQSDSYRQVVEALSVRSVNTTLLSQAYATDMNLRQMTQESMVVPEPTYARVRNEWTREDVNRAGVFGIFKVPIEDREEVVITREEYENLTHGLPADTVADAPEEPEEAQEEEPMPAAEPAPEPVRRGRGRPRRNPA